MTPALMAPMIEGVSGSGNSAPTIAFGWLSLIIPVAGFAIRAVVRAFTAETWVHRDCGGNIADVRDVALSSEIRPTLAAIIVGIQPYMTYPMPGEYLPGEPGDPELDAARVLGYRAATFSGPFTKLESDYADVHRAACVHGRRVAHARRAGAAMAVFLIAWLGLASALLFPDLEVPLPATYATLTVLGAAFGWANAEWSASNRENNGLSRLARSQRARSQGETR